MKTFVTIVTRSGDDPKRLSTLGEGVEKIGPLAYYPRYRVQREMHARTGLEAPNGLVYDFDAKTAWSEALSRFLHCANANDKKP